MSEETLSTTIPTEPAPSEGGGGTPAPDSTSAPAPEPEKLSLRDTIASEVKEEDGKAETAKADEPAKEEKAEKGPAKPAEARPDEAKAVDADEAKPEVKEAKKPTGHFEPPKTLQADAKEVWRNVPRAVQRDIDSTLRAHEGEVTQLREQTQRYESIREYDELAKSNGVELKDSLRRLAEFEDTMAANPVAGLNRVLQEVGPRKADGSPYSLFEVASAIAQRGEQGYQQLVALPAQPQEQQADPRVEQLEQQIAQMQQTQLQASIIEPFKADNPRYDELQTDIALFLKSGKVPANLSPSDRLQVAYDMAVRINPASDATTPKTDPEPASRVATDSSGSKSIKSTVGAVSPDSEPDRGGSIRDLLGQEMKRAKRA